MKTNRLLMVLLLLLAFATKAKAQEFKVKVSGKGHPILLFPGFASTGEVYDGIIKELSKNYELHVFTFAGFGEVPPIPFPWLPKIKTAVAAYVKKQKLHKPIIIGHSMGGTLALGLASESPQTYAKLIIIDGLPAMGALMMPNYKSENVVYDTPYNKTLLEMDKANFKKMADRLASSMSLNKDVHEKMSNWLATSDRKTYVYGYTDLLKTDLRDSLATISIPVRILVATQPYGKKIAEHTYQTQYQNLKNYTLNFAENAGHFIMYDQPAWFLTQLKSELEIQ